MAGGSKLNKVLMFLHMRLDQVYNVTPGLKAPPGARSSPNCRASLFPSHETPPPGRPTGMAGLSGLELRFSLPVDKPMREELCLMALAAAGMWENVVTLNAGVVWV